LGKPGGQTKRLYLGSYPEAMLQLEARRDQDIKRGFVPIPEQLGLF
jgi:hypothetical protein